MTSDLENIGCASGDIPAATAEDVEIAVDAARRALSRNKGKDWSSASGAVRAKYLREIAAKVLVLCICSRDPMSVAD